MHVSNYGTIFVTIADHDKEQALPLVPPVLRPGLQHRGDRPGPPSSCKAHGIRTRTRRKLSEGSEEIIEVAAAGACQLRDQHHRHQPAQARASTATRYAAAAVENNVTVFTALETVKVLLDVLEEITLRVSTIDSK